MRRGISAASTWATSVPPAISSDPDLYAYYQRLKIRRGANAAKVATARRLLTIVYRVLTQGRLYQKSIRTRKSPAPAALVTSYLMLKHRTLGKVRGPRIAGYYAEALPRRIGG